MRAIVNTVPSKLVWPAWMVVADREVGQRETPGSSTNNPHIQAYLSATRVSPEDRVDETAWCAAFVSWCLEHGGCVNPRYASARRYMHYGDKVETPQFGDILVFSRGSNEALGHVGFFVQDIGSDYEILSGNSRNSVRYGNEPKTDLLDIRRPIRLAE